MSSDLLFSILPRQGTVPIAHDELKVEKVTKESALRELSDKEQALHLEEREARQQQQSLNQSKSGQDDKQETHDTKTDKDPSADDDSDNGDKDSGFKHLDIYV
jgi:hypothetical protein